METVKAMAAKIDGLCWQLSTSDTTIKSLATRLTTIESLLKDTQAENTKLKEDLVPEKEEDRRRDGSE